MISVEGTGHAETISLLAHAERLAEQIRQGNGGKDAENDLAETRARIAKRRAAYQRAGKPFPRLDP